MSVTNIQLITDALCEISVLNESETPSAEQGADALRKLNQILEMWEVQGLALGWCEQLPADLSGSAPLPPYAERGVTLKLAMALAPSYGGAASVSPSLIAEFDEAYKVIERKCALRNIVEADTRKMPRAEGHSGTIDYGH